MSPDAGQGLSIIETALKRDRIIVLLGLAGIAILAWVYTVHAAWEMNNMDIETCMGLSTKSWGPTELFLLFLMWTVMMAAMMIPSVSQVVLLYAGSVRRNGRETGVVRLTGMFVLVYLPSWAGFSLLATLAQWGLHEAALISPMMVSTSPLAGGAILIAAGVFQWTPLKHACLRHCRSPLGFLMAVLFVTGVMNLLWVAVIAAFVLIEKLAPSGEWAARTAGILLAGYGLWMISQRLVF